MALALKTLFGKRCASLFWLFRNSLIEVPWRAHADNSAVNQRLGLKVLTLQVLCPFKPSVQMCDLESTELKYLLLQIRWAMTVLFTACSRSAIPLEAESDADRRSDQ